MSRSYLRNVMFGAAIAVLCTLPPGAHAGGGGLTGGATEWTQLLNNGELVSLVGQSTTQIDNQIRQITQLAEQIQNQLRIYQTMLQNTAQLPAHVWSDITGDLARLQSVVTKARGISFSMGNADDVLTARFKSYADFKTGLPSGQSFSSTYRDWSTTNRDTIAGTLAAAGLTAEQFASEGSTMTQLKAMSETSDGQMKALQVGHEIAAEQVAQMQKLRGLVAQQMTMMGTWYASEQANRDLAQARRESLFDATAPSTHGGQTMEPRW